MKKNRFFLSLFFIISYSFSNDNRWTESSFPGGYLSLGIQMGKTKDNSRFIDIQISPSFVLIGPYKHDFPGYLFYVLCFRGFSHAGRGPKFDLKKCV